MKKLFVLLVASLLACVSEAQSPSEVKVKFLDKEKRAASIEVPYPSDLVEKAIEDKMARRGSRPEKVRGYTLYRAVKVREDGGRADLYFNVERKGRKEKNSSIVTVFALTPNENASSADSDDDKIRDSKDLLVELMPAIESKDVELNIASHDAEIREAERKLKSLENDYADLDKKMKTLQQKMDDNKRNQELQTAEIEKLKAFLEALKEKKTS